MAYHDPAMKAAIARFAARVSHEQGNKLWGCFGERNARDAFMAGLDCGLLIGANKMYETIKTLAEQKAPTEDV